MRVTDRDIIRSFLLENGQMRRSLAYKIMYGLESQDHISQYNKECRDRNVNRMMSNIRKEVRNIGKLEYDKISKIYYLIRNSYTKNDRSIDVTSEKSATQTS